ncbi:hypothetical protein GRS48_09155 [Halorubrum sp. JWXQ-INN 858]|uniref:hypothetical protein n=1 Tax=Halorubrum sp. JWXQ-INN 858 TaxID=2690782 RepID=UPI00135C55D1|nr:hypothetical protein [Halorubrum sp. JWXQ-INN 858]MWV64983.1 hypothetical protein [Halorubrum sp. JWXQ-INN 858]
MTYDHMDLDVLPENAGERDPMIATPPSVDKPTVTTDMDLRCVDHTIKIESVTQFFTGSISRS